MAGDLNREASELWNSLKPIIDKEIDARTQGMVQRRKAKVTTAPSLATNTIGVTEPFGPEMFLPFNTNIMSASVGDFVWVEYMYGMTNAFVSMFASADDKNQYVAGNLTVDGTLDVDGSATFDGDATVGGALSVTNRRASMTSNVAAGWHRVLEFAPTTATYRLGRAGIIIDFDITRYATTNETHHVSLSLIETNAKFYGEFSNSNTQLIDKIRYTYDSSKGYVDIHLSTTSTYNVAVDYQVAASFSAALRQITTKSLAAVADSPSGETVLTEHTFISNTDGDYTFSDKYGKDWYFRKRNGVVYIDAPNAMTPDTNGSNSIGTLPAEFKPTHIVRIPAANAYGAGKWLYIDTSGGVYAVCYSTVGTSTGFSVTGSYLAMK